jgi:hypothetical protein
LTRYLDKSTTNWFPVASWVAEVYAWSIILTFFDLTQPQRPLTEKELKFNMSFHDSVKKNFFSKKQNKVILVLKLLNSRAKTTLKSSVLIFQALETSPAWLTSVASASSLASTASKVQFSQKNILILMIWSSLAPK